MWNKILTIVYELYNNNKEEDDNSSHELEECKEVENYGKVMKSHPNYLTILYNLTLVYIHMLKKIYLAKIKRIT